MSEQLPRLIFLIGFMGSGKTHEGELLAEHLGLPFIDLDDWIEEQEGRTISEIFKTEGEYSFRNIEAAALQQAASNLLRKGVSGIVSANFVGIISTGGGTPCFHGNIDWMNDNGVTVWLNLPIELLVKRLSKETSKRPLISSLKEDELHHFIEKKLEERRPYYSKSNITINEEIDSITLTQKIINA
jgi:shikimate kinase